WLEKFEGRPGVTRVVENDITYLIGAGSTEDSKLLVISGQEFFDAIPSSLRLECFHRILRAGLSEFRPGLVKMPLTWRRFNAGSLTSFQSNRQPSGITFRVYADLAPEATSHVYIFHLSKVEEPLTRAKYNADLFVDAVLNYEHARRKGSKPK